MLVDPDEHPSFYKLLFKEGFIDKILMPPAFIKENKSMLAKTCLLKMDEGVFWEAKIVREKCGYFLCEGEWPQFVEYHRLDLGDVLLFFLIDKSTFQVLSYKQKHYGNLRGKQVFEELSSSSKEDKDEDEDEEDEEEPPRKSKKCKSHAIECSDANAGERKDPSSGSKDRESPWYSHSGDNTQNQGGGQQDAPVVPNFVSFPEPENYELYERQLPLAFILERGFDMANMGTRAPEFIERLLRIGWTRLVTDPGPFNETMVREFYAMLPTVNWRSDNPEVVIRGVKVKVGSKAINKVYRLADHSDEPYKAKLAEKNAAWLASVVVHESELKLAPWAMGRTSIKTECWTAEAKRWLNIVSRRVCPSSNIHDVTFARALVVACVLADIPVNVGCVVIRAWQEFLTMGRGNLMFPSLITLLCRKAKVPEVLADKWTRSDAPFHPLKCKGYGSAMISRKKRRGDALGEGTGGGGASGSGAGGAAAAGVGSGPPQLTGAFGYLNTRFDKIEEMIKGLRLQPDEGGPSGCSLWHPTHDQMREYMDTQAQLLQNQVTIGENVSSLAKSYRELVEKTKEMSAWYEKEEKKNKSRDKLRVRTWKTIKGLWKNSMPQEPIPDGIYEDSDRYSFASSL